MAKLENYNGSVELMAGITQKGGGDFAMVEANAVQTREDGTRLDAELESLQGLVGDTAVSEQINAAIAAIPEVEAIPDSEIIALFS